ncbi:MAG: prepilin-type N-terminal cleavage/methylation domain-containing protein [Marinobacter sp.]|uniref:prepilin-type N-terminal cleavage/methylation domain-containing protein n=1 Tax=Marinobacter sp. TaxID=50741 RepID=UPI003298665D
MTIKNAPRSSGFTLVELVMVIILIGVLSALGVGLFAGRSAFSPLLVTQQLASATLLAQQAALAGQPNASLRIEHPAGGGPLFKAQFDPDGDGANPPIVIQEFTMPGGDVSVTLDGMVLPVTIGFDKLGALDDRNNRSIDISGETSFTICLSSLGAVYQGECDAS